MFTVEEFLDASQTERQDEQVSRPRASMLGDCSRKIGYAMSATPRTNQPPGRVKFTMAQGLHMEGLIDSVLERLGYTVHRNIGDAQSIGEGYPVSGHWDSIIEKDGQRILVEQKHLGVWTYLRIGRNGLYAERPGYLLQALLYADALDIKKVLFVITSQDASAVQTQLNRSKMPPDIDAKVQLLWFDVDDYRDVLNVSIQRALWFVNNQPGVTVQREYNPALNKPPCNMCDWQDRCLSDGVGNQLAPFLPWR